MIISNRFLAISISSLLLLSIFELIRRRKLKEKYAVLWLFSGSIILFFAVFNNILDWLTGLLGIMLPVNTAFFFGILFIILVNMHFSLVISNLSEQNKIIAQKLALLDADLKKLTKK